MKRNAYVLLLLMIFTALGVCLLLQAGDDTLYFSPGMTVRQFAQQNDLKPGRLKEELGMPFVRGRTTLGDLGIDKAQAAAVASALQGDLFVKRRVAVFLLFAASVILAVLLLRRNTMTGPAKYGLLLIAVAGFGFALGKTYNPMVSMVKVFKGFAGLESNLAAWVLVLALFCILAIVGTKAVCGWVCPFGALQEILFKLPLIKNWKKKHTLPFWCTNCIRIGLFGLCITGLTWNLFGLTEQGQTIYHFINPFNLFELSGMTMAVTLYIAAALGLSLFFYRPHCYCVCPFGLLSWLLERISVYRIRINRQKCTGCGACIAACPGEAMQGLYAGDALPADCFSCGECLTACTFDALSYTTTPAAQPAVPAGEGGSGSGNAVYRHALPRADGAQ